MAAAVAMSAAASALVGLSVNAPTHETKLKAIKVADLKAVCAHFGLLQAGDKTALTDRIRKHKLAAAGAASPAPSRAGAEALHAGSPGLNDRRRLAAVVHTRGYRRDRGDV
jgi:hypothetical protein